MAINFNGTSVSNANMNGTALDLVTVNGTDVFSNLADYSFPRTEAKMTSNTSLGFTLSGSATVNSSHPYWHSLSMDTSKYCAFKGNGSSYLDIKFPSEMGCVILYQINIASTNGSAWGLNGATVRTGIDTLDNSEVFGTFNNNQGGSLSKSGGVSCNIIRITPSHNDDAGYGNITLYFKTNQAKLTAWKNKYGIS